MAKSRRRDRRSRRRRAAADPLDADLPELRQARQYWQYLHFDAALEWFEKAVRRHPRNLMALIDAARAFGARYQVRKAEEWLVRATEAAGNDPVVLHLVAQTYRMIARPQAAMPLFEQIVHGGADVPDAYLELALLYERRHRLEEATALVEECLRRDPTYQEPRLVYARLLRRRSDGGRADSVLHDLIADPAADPLLKAQAWADLAELLDARGEYDEAWQSINRCKAIQLERDEIPKRLSDHLLATFGRMADEVRREDFVSWDAAIPPGERRRVALLAGFPRSGTTLLEQVLDAHPGHVSSEELEVFSRDVFPQMAKPTIDGAPMIAALRDLGPDRWLALRRQYLRSMEEVAGAPIGGRVHLDKNPTLTLLIPAFRRLLPEATLLLALRDPRDVVLSCYLRYLPLNTNSVWYLTPQRAAQRYATDMSGWLTLRDKLPSGWLEVRYEDVVADLEGQARRCLDALGLPWDESVRDYRTKLAGKAVQSPTYEAVTRPVYGSSIGRWRNYQKYLEPVLPVLEPFIKTFGYTMV